VKNDRIWWVIPINSRHGLQRDMLLRVVPEEGQDVLPEDSTAVGERVALTDIAFEPSCYGESL